MCKTVIVLPYKQNQSITPAARALTNKPDLIVILYVGICITPGWMFGYVQYEFIDSCRNIIQKTLCVIKYDSSNTSRLIKVSEPEVTVHLHCSIQVRVIVFDFSCLNWEWTSFVGPSKVLIPPSTTKHHCWVDIAFYSETTEENEINYFSRLSPSVQELALALFLNNHKKSNVMTPTRDPSPSKCKSSRWP